MPTRVDFNCFTGEINESFCGEHVLLSIDEYNAIVRVLNNVQILLMEHEPKPIVNGFIDQLIKHNSKLETVD